MPFHRRVPWALILLGFSALLLSACQGEFTVPVSELEALSEISEIELSLDQSGLETEFVGAIDQIGSDFWIIAGQELLIRPWTEIKGSFSAGQLVKVHARLSDEGAWIAREIEAAAATDDDEPDGSYDEVEFFGTVESVQPGLWRIGGRDVEVTPQTEVKGLIGEGDLVKVHARPGPGGVWVAREIELAGADDLMDDDEHGLDDDGDEVEFWGVVQEIGDGEWKVGGRTLVVIGDTEIDGGIEVGDFVKVEAVSSESEALIALEIETEDDDHDADDDRDHDDDEDHDEEEHDEDEEEHDEDRDEDHDHDDED